MIADKWIEKCRNTDIEIDKMKVFAVKIHERICVQLGISGFQKSFFISGILIALQDDSFVSSFRHIKDPENLSYLLLASIGKIHRKYFKHTEEDFSLYFKFIRNDPILKSSEGVLLYFIEQLYNNIVIYQT